MLLVAQVKKELTRLLDLAVWRALETLTKRFWWSSQSESLIFQCESFGTVCVNSPFKEFCCEGLQRIGAVV